MDDIVKAALRKWPHVPHVRGWLGLDARGAWYLRDEAAQAAGAFPAVRGSRIEHEALQAFIGRNYEADAQGAWFFQNGPQRVYAELEAAPWIWRVRWDGNAAHVHDHIGTPCTEADPAQPWTDEHGRLFLQLGRRYGLVHTQDVADAAAALDAGLWPAPEALAFAAMPARFGYVLSPAAAGA